MCVTCDNLIIHDEPRARTPEPEFDYVGALLPFQPLACRAKYCPIDPRVNLADANALIRAAQPKHLIMPAAYAHPNKGLNLFCSILVSFFFPP